MNTTVQLQKHADDNYSFFKTKTSSIRV